MKASRTVLTGVALLAGASMTMGAVVLQTQLIADGATNGGVALSDGDRINTTAGRVWDDSTANGNDAQGPGQFESARFNTGSVGTFNGADYVDVKGSQWHMTGAASVAANAWAFSTVMVANIADHDEERAIMSLGNSTSGVGYTYLQFAADGENLTVGYRDDGFTFRDASTTGMNFSGAEHIFTAVYRAADDIEVFVDGASVLTYTGATGLLKAADQYALGGTADSSADLIGNDTDFDIAEARVYTGAWGAGEREAMESALGSTYGITVVPEPSTMATLLFGAALLALIRKHRLA